MICLIYLPDLTDLIYLFDLYDLDHYKSNLSDKSDLDHDLSIYLFDRSYLDHDLSDLSVRYVWSWTLSIWSNRSLWIRSWSAWHICPINLIWSIRLICLFYTMTYLIHLSNLVDLDHHLSVLSVRSIWHIMINLSDLYDLDHDMSDPSVRSIWLISWSILSICPIYIT